MIGTNRGKNKIDTDEWEEKEKPGKCI